MVFPLAIVVALGWSAYFFSTAVPTWWVFLLIGTTLVVVVMFTQGMRRTAAANNVVFAAATFSRLVEDDRRRVDMQVLEIFERTGWNHGFEGVDTIELWAFRALAMRELGIRPVGDMPAWNFVRKPFTAILASDHYLRATLDRAKAQGFDVADLVFPEG